MTRKRAAKPFPIGATVHTGSRADVRWSDNKSVTTGDPASAHMRALIARCLRDYGPHGGVDVTSIAFDEGFSLRSVS